MSFKRRILANFVYTYAGEVAGVDRNAVITQSGHQSGMAIIDHNEVTRLSAQIDLLVQPPRRISLCANRYAFTLMFPVKSTDYVEIMGLEKFRAPPRIQFTNF